MTAVDLPAVPRVLIAEADLWSRDLLKQVLLNVRCDARLDLCADGQEAMTLLSEVPYDLAIVDWELPGVDGLSVLRSVRQRKRNPPLPFILMSSRNDSASVREALQQPSSVEEVVFCCFSAQDLGVYERLLGGT